MSDLDVRRRVFAEEIEICCNLRTAALVEALAVVPRERFLGPGPWTIIGEADGGRGPRATPDADPRHLYHNVAVAIDPARQLFNGAPGVISMAIDALALEPGDRVLHVGAGFGYYTALIAHTVGSGGHVVAIEVDESLAAGAARNLSALSWVDVERGDASAVGGPFDAILINAGVTHPQEAWLDALRERGRMVLPLTATFPQMGPIGKGPLMLLSGRGPDGSFEARALTIVAIYSAIGLRDDALNATLGKALMNSPFIAVRRLRRDAHEPDGTCWYHTCAFCFTQQIPPAGQP
jgi:protein-L-isoaspartate(D-aspartate) O-methyltransferase